ncbi:MAG: hypothetical protein INQ03_06500 [Candidatus Heimdallarchaeota archaeon]|nr:hypothetical protein [Candidatus Heimdallarchaeota archaeon]
MNEDIEEKLTRMKHAIELIIAKAKEDGKITPEEESLIKTAEDSIGEFERMVKSALEDGIIDQDERNSLIDLEEKMMGDTYEKALEDMVMDKDELAILKTLFHEINPRQSLSWLDDH